MKDNDLELLASLLDSSSADPEKKISDSVEEGTAKKLAFIWNECLPEDVGELDIWSKTQKKIADSRMQLMRDERKKQIHKRKIWISFTVAASVSILLGLAFLHQGDEKRSDFAQIARSLQTEIKVDEAEEVTLVVSDDKKIVVDNNAKIIYSATGQVSVNADQLDKEETKAAYNQVIVPKGRRSQIVLADNSKIWINSGSKVVYPSSFEGKYREIFVEGEVYLEVAHNADKPFIVNTSGFEVQVLGTSFNVTAYKGENEASVVLVEGSVNIKDENKRQIQMVPNERVALNRNSISTKKKVNVSDYISWVNGVWVLRGESLKTVLQHLEKYYGRPISCDSAFMEEPMYGKLFLNDDINKVMKSIMSTLHNTHTMKDSIILK